MEEERLDFEDSPVNMWIFSTSNHFNFGPCSQVVAATCSAFEPLLASAPLDADRCFKNPSGGITSPIIILVQKALDGLFSSSVALKALEIVNPPLVISTVPSELAKATKASQTKCIRLLKEKAKKGCLAWMLPSKKF